MSGHLDSVRRWGSDAYDVGGEEVDAVSVEVLAGSVVVLGGAWVGVSGEDLGVGQWNAGVEGVLPDGTRRLIRRDGIAGPYYLGSCGSLLRPQREDGVGFVLTTGFS